MEINNILYYFIAQWGITPNEFAIQDNKFVKELFDDPLNTISGNNPNGFMINRQIPSGPVTDMVLLNQTFIQIVTKEKGIIFDLLEKVGKKLMEINPAPFDFSFYIINLIIDKETNGLGQKKASSFLAKNLLNNVKPIKELAGSSINVNEINFEIKKNEQEKVTFQIQPRINNQEEIFIKTTLTSVSKMSLAELKSIDKKIFRFDSVANKQIINLIDE